MVNECNLNRTISNMLDMKILEISMDYYDPFWGNIML